MAQEAKKPEPFEVKIESSRSACAGAAAAFLLRRIASCAGAYAPGIQERLFFELEREGDGASLDRVWHWYGRSAQQLHHLGYRVGMRRVAFRTPSILGWVESGSGFRGAVLNTDLTRLRSEQERPSPHAVAVTIANGKRGKDQLRVVDPWPDGRAPEKPPAALEEAHRHRKYGALVVYWSGWW